MALIGVFSGLLFVPLNALIQWRSPDDRRGAVIALANVLVYAGMLAGSLLALALAERRALGAGDVPGGLGRPGRRAPSGHSRSSPTRSSGSC